MGSEVTAETLKEMAEYYRARAAEYDEWFYRRGRYDHGPEASSAWFAEAEEVASALTAAQMTGDVLELAPGTGIWTQRLLHTAGSITAVDSSAEMIEINCAKLGSGRVAYVQADIFEWQPHRRFDGVFFGFWLSHVPVERLDGFLMTVAAALKPGGKVFFVDGRREPTSTASDHTLPGEGSQVMIRRLNDGREYRIVKNFHEKDGLRAAFNRAGLSAAIHETATYFMYGVAARANPGPHAAHEPAGI